MNAKVNTCIISRKQTMGSFYINVRYSEESGICPSDARLIGIEGKFSNKALKERVHCSFTRLGICVHFFSFNQTVKIKKSQPVTSDRLLVWLLKGDNSSLCWLSAWGPQEDPRAQSDHTGRLKEGRCGFTPAVIDLCHSPGGALAS